MNETNNIPPQIPRPPVTRTVTFTVHSNDWINELYAQLEWLRSLTDIEIKKQKKIKIT